MEGRSQPATPPVVLAAGEGKPFWFLHDRMVLKATAETTGGAYGLIESLVPPGFAPPMHVHWREDETFWVIEGSLTYRVGEETYAAGPGSYVFLPRGVPHGFVVESETPVRMLTMLTPGGGERFFVEAGRPAAGPGFPPPEPLDLDLLRRVSDRFGLELAGPPLRARSAGAHTAPPSVGTPSVGADSAPVRTPAANADPAPVRTPAPDADSAPARTPAADADSAPVRTPAAV